MEVVKVDFKNTVIVMTSNLGSDLIQTMSGESYEAMQEAVMGIVSQRSLRCIRIAWCMLARSPL